MCDCFVNCCCNFHPSPAYQHHRNLGLIMSSFFCNLNVYRAPSQHPQSSTLHLHTDAEANRPESFGINTVCHQHLLTQSLNQRGPFANGSCSRSASFKLAVRVHDTPGKTEQTHVLNEQLCKILPESSQAAKERHFFYFSPSVSVRDVLVM